MDVDLTGGEALRILLVTLCSVNIGVTLGRLRFYIRSRAVLRKRLGTEAESETAASVVLFLSGFLIVLASVAWRVIQLYRQPLSAPLFSLALGLLVSLLGLHFMGHNLTAKILVAAQKDLGNNNQSKPK